MFTVIPLPALQDNYIWLIRDDRHAVVVDPGDAAPVLDYLAREQLQLTAILNTHHHPDHVGGNTGLLSRFKVPVYGPAKERIPTMTHPLAEGDSVELPAFSLRLSVLDIGGHTAGHIGYYGANSLFCGDTLFGCGCGRLFEGTPQQMLASLQKLANLPDATNVFCGHEYTLANIRFAKSVDPDNADLLAREKKDTKARAANLPTLPSTIKLEKDTNPFLRCSTPEVVKAANHFTGRTLSDAVDVFAAIRAWKNQF